MKSYKMEVSKKGTLADGSTGYVKQGEVDIHYPLLNELGLNAEASGVDSDGFPTYADTKVQYVFDAVLAAVKAAARNKLQSGTATLKPGLTIASTVDELMETGGRTGDALAAVREFLAAFKAWLPTTGKSEKLQAAVYELARNKNAVILQSDEKKAKFAVYLTDFARSLNEEQMQRYSRPLLALNEACESGDPFDEKEGINRG